ncbi:hypothetical protein BU24DRAFT_488386 [Aaosphaeria arxii CBS 175.79]|uniref:Uncharacterized protein n=1 Tax=Aaosphaeria arxii CBS 175.79 TaxID=1450172 RepID=A0A6A5Y9K9_9PLEO|nr:uncharacterized protein BU24DRAFT_488386 [Aaosphaeria arxii CBS 175.79]KAF2022098.1 hypothetical protein BU24DRAFT_488386 [Aaosphaeria arxii CBS 175.79]
MASTAAVPTAFTPYQSSPLARTTSPFKDPRTPPQTPSQTAKLWDEYERRAVEIAKRRETACATRSARTGSSPQRLSSGIILDVTEKHEPIPSTGIAVPSPVLSPPIHSNFDFDFHTPTYRKPNTDTPPATVAICKTCRQSITTASGFCEQCKRTIVLSPPLQTGETTPPLSPACRNFASTDLSKLERISAQEPTTPNSTSPKRRTRKTSCSQTADHPIRLSSLRPPPKQSLDETHPRVRKASLTDPNEAFIRLHISRKPLPSQPSSPTTPTTPPPTAHSHHTSGSHPRTRPSSLANITTPPQYASYPRHNSVSPSELSTLYPYVSMATATTTSPSLHRTSYSLQNTTSAWDDSDSEGEEEKAGLVGYWRSRKWRGSRGSIGTQDTSRGRRTSDGTEEGRKESSVREEGKRKKRGAFVRVISCGCND